MVLIKHNLRPLPGINDRERDRNNTTPSQCRPTQESISFGSAPSYRYVLKKRNWQRMDTLPALLAWQQAQDPDVGLLLQKLHPRHSSFTTFAL